LPTDRPRPAAQSFQGSYHQIRWPEKLRQRLAEVGRRQGVTRFMTLLAAFNALLYRCTGQSDVVVGSPVANRARAEFEGLVGFFSNMLVMRTRVDGSLTFRDLMERVRSVALEAYDHQDLPFQKLVEFLKPERDPSRNPF